MMHIANDCLTHPIAVKIYPAVRISGPPVEGTLLGGNLCLMAASIGTPDHPDDPAAGGRERTPYKIDRM